MLLRFADQDMFMHYHWGSGVGHVYANSTTLEPVSSISSDSSEATAPCQSEPKPVVPNCCEDEDDSDRDHSVGHSSLGDQGNSDLDNDSTVEVAAMYDWQDEGGAEYEF